MAGRRGFRDHKIEVKEAVIKMIGVVIGTEGGGVGGGEK
jgi:hypothetical protein